MNTRERSKYSAAGHGKSGRKVKYSAGYVANLKRDVDAGVRYFWNNRPVPEMKGRPRKEEEKAP